ncbi:MAG: organic hydroperoxide resistance protein [Nesterenkonia sp.]|uniref:organic hydroperoxide resistance protein n=1 Tax=Nesterenkonia marinintestina TaxID=2979865 RepID=UPI0021BF1F97|nr:organic hydroperoxide resistance protein [Nesterenkonia sp. GX14115]MDO5492736.1 organic hydroperoxide resistance protein [Nesterenkonia sp.]
METLYTAEAIATGSGRDGHVRTDDSRIDLGLSAPEAMGGDGQGSNPEQLFASGYAACFHGALQLVAKQAGKDVGDSSVGAKVSIGKGEDGMGLAVTLEVVVPNLPQSEAQELADQAHQVCPYSKATRGNIDVDVVVTDD